MNLPRRSEPYWRRDRRSTFFSIEAIEVGNSNGRWESPAQVPFNFTEMGENILIPDNAKFEQVKPWGKNATKADGTDADPQDPEVYFTFCFCCDKDPETILQRVRPEWRRQGGNRLELKELGCFNTETALVLYFMHNECNEQSTVRELSRILERARNEEKEHDKEFSFANNDIPLMSTRILMPKVPGQDTSMYDDWHWRDSNKRKAIHIECAEEDVNHLQTLVEIAKRRNLIAAMWGKQVKLSNVVKTKKKGKRRAGGKDQETSAHELDKARSYAVRHTNYNASMTTAGIIGIYDLDKEVEVFSESDSSKKVGTYSLRGALYTVKMTDGRTLFAELHQAGAMACVDVVIGKTSEAEEMVEMMNKNVAAYLSNYLAEAKLPPALIKRLLEVSVDPTLLLDVGNCKWDSKTRTLTTPNDAENEESLALEKAAWYNNDFGIKMGKTLAEEARKKQSQLMNPEDIYQIDKDDHTYHTLNERAGTYDGSPGAVRLNLGEGREENDVEILDADDDASCVSNLTNITDYSKRDLYNKIKEMQISLANQQGSSKEGTASDGSPLKKTWTEGSAPQGNLESQQTTPGDEGSPSHDDDSSLSSTSSEEEESGPAAAPSG